MNYSIVDFLQLLGALGVFIYGMKVMSEGIQKAAGENLRKILSGMTRNRFAGVFTGFFVTCLIQSSSATTVMVVSFVNAGLLSLVESIGVIMGANIGTTITAWIISIFGFKVKIISFALPLIGFSFPFMFSNNNRYKSIAEFVMGFGILFIGLDFLKNSVPDIKSNPEIMSFISAYTELGFGSVLIFVIVGFLLTVLVQSSSASLAITLVMVAQGWIEFDMAAAMFLGGNMGTTVTAILASFVGNIHAKRAALFHCIFNVVGVVWVIFLLYPILDFIDTIMMAMGSPSAFSTDPQTHKETTTLALSLFHTTFNVANTLILIWFVPIMEKLVIRLMPSRGDLDEEFHLQYIGTSIMGTPELAITEARKEIQLFGKQLKKMSDGFNEMATADSKEHNKWMNKIKKWEDITDRLEVEIADYLAKCASGSLSSVASDRIRSMMNIINDMERIGDIYYQMSQSINRIKEKKINFPTEAQGGLENILKKVGDFIDLMNQNLQKDHDMVSMDPVFEMEEIINKLRDDLRKQNAIRLENGDYGVRDGILYLDIVNSAEKIGDHVVNVNEAYVGLK
ncbi:MAG: Na/Pi cotransporter [Bacteroidetes bacterium]|nr:Na/Pi cotransporter family protein [Bacteroidia bacterium]PCH67798.1 MAG: Na/Pi cotransporter [Bacteroidota bacterium]